MFTPESVFRGAQLTLVGAYRALLNPDLFKSKHYKVAVQAVLAGIVINIVVQAPIYATKGILWLASFVTDLEKTNVDEQILGGLQFIQHVVLQVPLFLMALTRYLDPRPLDDVFMTSLLWVDKTNQDKHVGEKTTPFYDNLRLYPYQAQKVTRLTPFVMRWVKKATIALVLYTLSLIPYAGKLVLPVASFSTFQQTSGFLPALVIFSAGFILPRSIFTRFLQGFFASRSLVRELLTPYFARLHMSSKDRRRWFRERGGVMFGFGVGFYVLLKVPFVGILMYGIAQASTAYLLTKTTQPPPPPLPPSTPTKQSKHE